MANNTYVWSYLLFALLVFLMVFQQVAVGDKNPVGEEKVKIPENLATEAEKSISLRDTLQRIYRAEIGVRERKGNNDGKRVEEYLAVTNLDKGYAWCAAFISWTFAQVGFEEPNTPWSPALGKVAWFLMNQARKAFILPEAYFKMILPIIGFGFRVTTHFSFIQIMDYRLKTANSS